MDADFADFAEALYRDAYSRHWPGIRMGERAFTLVPALQTLPIEGFCEICGIRAIGVHVLSDHPGRAVSLPGRVRFLDFGPSLGMTSQGLPCDFFAESRSRRPFWRSFSRPISTRRPPPSAASSSALADSSMSCPTGRRPTRVSSLPANA